MKIELKGEELKIIITALAYMCGKDPSAEPIQLNSYDAPRYQYVLEHLLNTLTEEMKK